MTNEKRVCEATRAQRRRALRLGLKGLSAAAFFGLGGICAAQDEGAREAAGGGMGAEAQSGRSPSASKDLHGASGFIDYSPAGHPVDISADAEEVWDGGVIGAGAAGLAAALEARRAGARVVLLEKMGSICGNSVLSEGLVGIPGSPCRRRAAFTIRPNSTRRTFSRAATSRSRRAFACARRRRAKLSSGRAASVACAGGTIGLSTKSAKAFGAQP